MKDKLYTYEVSSADWNIEVDGENQESAAISAILFMLNRHRRNLLLSTTIMVNEILNCNTTNLMNASFFLTSSILNKIGEYDLSTGLKQLTKDFHEIKSITK